MSDRIDTIVAGVNRKDEKTWGDFYDRFYAALCVYVSKILPIPDAVEDLVQEVFISVWEGKRTFSDINQIHYSILSSLAVECREDEDMIYALTVKEEIIRQLYFHIEELPPEQRRIILLRIEGYTWEEIAERLEISINTVKTQKSRSYKFLREKLGDSIHSIILCLFF